MQLKETIPFQVRVLYDFEAQDGTGEMTVRAGEVLTIIRKDVGEGWWEGSNTDGQAGLFPASYVEEISANPPAMPPPPLPAEYANTGEWGDEWAAGQNWSAQNTTTTASNTTTTTAEPTTTHQPISAQQSYDNDDWDDDWDDDDSDIGGNSNLNGAGNYGLSYANRSIKPSSSYGDVSNADKDQKGTVRRSFYRFTPLAKSGVEDYLVGVSKIPVGDSDKVHIEDMGRGIQWTPNSNQFTCSITEPHKESKFKGMKSFIVYNITPSFSNKPVARRYKHFDWLQERLSAKFPLIPLPPLPEKQLSGRFEDDLIEYRRTMLQSWIDRICRHPVLSQCEVFHHFVTCPNDEKMWKMGKRKAEKDEFVGANFYLAIQHPEASHDLAHVENKLDGYNRFFTNMDEAVKLLQNTCIDQNKKHQTAYKREFTKISHAFAKLGRAFDMDASNRAPALTEAVHHVSEAYNDIGTFYEEEPKHDWEPLNNLLFEYKGLIDGFPSVISATKGSMAKCKQVEKDAQDGKVDHDQVPIIKKRSDTVMYALEAEVAHFQCEREDDYKRAMVNFLTEQISFYQRITDRLRQSLEKFSQV